MPSAMKDLLIFVQSFALLGCGERVGRLANSGEYLLLGNKLRPLPLQEWSLTPR
jgi:hypothetical protein